MVYIVNQQEVLVTTNYSSKKHGIFNIQYGIVYSTPKNFVDVNGGGASSVYQGGVQSSTLRKKGVHIHEVVVKAMETRGRVGLVSNL